jgi:putative ATPase
MWGLPDVTIPPMRRDKTSDVDHLFLPWKKSAPLAARMRPRHLDEYVGQEALLGPGKLLRRAIEADRIGSIILWGPPGSGKTTLARVIAGATSSRFETINAVLAGVKDIRSVVAEARQRLEEPADLFQTNRRTTLFVDEVHRFNKAQQDALLPHVENGTIVFIGATTENPYFEVIKALVSRSRIFQLGSLTSADLKRVARAAIDDPERGYGELDVEIEDAALDHLSEVANGDARNLLNALELAVETTIPDDEGTIRIDHAVAEESIQRRALLYDKDGDAHYDTISAFIKSMRGSDPDATLYWLAKMLGAGEDPRFVCRRMVIFASEDVGMADPQALGVATAAARAVEYVGMPECQWNLSQAAIYLATAPKSNSAMAYFEALRHIQDSGDGEVPDPLKDATRDKEGLGHGKGYKYPHAYREHWVPQQYLPEAMQGLHFYQPSEVGHEAKVRDEVERLRELQADGLSAERRIEDLTSGRARRWKSQVEEYGESRVRFRERLLELAGLDMQHAVLDVGGRAGLLGWGALERVPLGHVHVLVSDATAADGVTRKAGAESVDRLVSPLIGECAAIPVEDASFDRVLGAGVLHGRDERQGILGELARVLRDSGSIFLYEPLLSLVRRLSEEVDLRPLGDSGVARVREAEDLVYGDTADPRMRLSVEELEGLADRVGLEVVDRQESLDTVRRKVTPEVVVRWFSGTSEGRRSYEENLLETLSRDEVAAYRRLFEEQILGRMLNRPVPGVVMTLRKFSRV